MGFTDKLKNMFGGPKPTETPTEQPEAEKNEGGEHPASPEAVEKSNLETGQEAIDKMTEAVKARLESSWNNTVKAGKWLKEGVTTILGFLIKDYKKTNIMKAVAVGFGIGSIPVWGAPAAAVGILYGSGKLGEKAGEIYGKGKEALGRGVDAGVDIWKDMREASRVRTEKRKIARQEIMNSISGKAQEIVTSALNGLDSGVKWIEKHGSKTIAAKDRFNEKLTKAKDSFTNWKNEQRIKLLDQAELIGKTKEQESEINSLKSELDELKTLLRAQNLIPQAETPNKSLNDSADGFNADAWFDRRPQEPVPGPDDSVEIDLSDDGEVTERTQVA